MDKSEYMHHARRMQAGVEYTMEDSKECQPKHLRVGINAAMSDMGGLVGLLIKKGIISEEEYLEAITASMKREADAYENRLQQKFSPNWETDIRLGGTIEDL
jgi:hypothetical protein